MYARKRMNIQFNNSICVKHHCPTLPSLFFTTTITFHSLVRTSSLSPKNSLTKLLHYRGQTASPAYMRNSSPFPALKAAAPRSLSSSKLHPMQRLREVENPFRTIGKDKPTASQTH